jgi:hypothetical protein
MSPDPLDRAAEYVEKQTNAAIVAIKTQGRELNPIGACRWCKEPFNKGSLTLFCDTDCRDDYEHDNRR